VRVAPPVRLSPEERARLSRRRHGRGPAALRARLVLLAADGLTDQEIGHREGVDRQTVARWRHRFLVERLEGLAPSAPGARPGRIPEETVQSIVRATVTRRPRDPRGASTRRLAEEFGVSHMTVRRVWDSFGVRPSRVETFPPRLDPSTPVGPRDLVGLFLNSERAALAWTLAARGDGGAAPLADARQSTEGASADPGALSLAFRSLGPRPHPEDSAPSGGREFLAFLGAVQGGVGGDTPVRVLATGVEEEARTAVERWRVRHPRFEIDLVTGFGAWKDAATRLFRALDRPSGGVVRPEGTAEVSRSLARFLGSYRTDGPPYRWIAASRGPAAGRTGGNSARRLRYDLSATGHPGFPSTEAVAPRATAPEVEEERRASARNVLKRYLRVRPGERVTIETWTSTLPEANAFVLETLRLGGRPLLLYQDEPTYWAATTEVSAAALAHLGEHRRAALARTDVFVSFLGPSDRERFHALPNRVRFRLGEYADALYDAAAKAGARTVQMAVGRVSEASARMYGVDVRSWRAELLAGTLVDPRVLQRRARLVADRLARGREVRIRHPNGTDLRLRLAGRTPVRSDGRVTAPPKRGDWTLVTLPAGVVVTALDETFAEGVFESNVATSVGLSGGVGEFRVGRWTFAEGRLRRYVYREGQELFSEGYERAGEGRDRPGALSIGLNENLAQSPLLEDQALGTVTLQIGRNDFLGGRTRLPWWAWLNLRGADLAVDGRPLLRAGSLVP